MNKVKWEDITIVVEEEGDYCKYYKIFPNGVIVTECGEIMFKEKYQELMAILEDAIKKIKERYQGGKKLYG